MNNNLSTSEIIMAGFGGQGILFAGKLLAYAGMPAGKEVSWLPSYGPEMRGGTANCHIIISDEKVGSPIIVNPSVLIAMNKPSLVKFEDSAVAGALVVIDSTLIDRNVKRQDVTGILIPATQMANEISAPKLANMVIIGKMLKETNILPMDIIKEVLKKITPASKPELLEINMKAIMLGFEY